MICPNCCLLNNRYPKEQFLTKPVGSILWMCQNAHPLFLFLKKENIKTTKKHFTSWLLFTFLRYLQPKTEKQQ